MKNAASKWDSRALKVLLPFIILVMLLVWNTKPRMDEVVRVKAQDGVWDISGMDFSKDVASLEGEVEYVAEQLLEPEEFAAQTDIQFGHPHRQYQYCTSRITVQVPDGEYLIYSTSVEYASRLYANGELLLEVGKPGENFESTQPETRTYTLPVHAENGRITIIQQASNFVHRESGGHGLVYIGSPRVMNDFISRHQWPSVIIMGCYLALFVMHLILYAFQRDYPQNLLFALFCLTWFLRTGVTGNKLLAIAFPWMDWYTTFRIEYLALPATCVLLVWFLHRMFPGIMHPAFPRIASAVGIAFGLLYLFADTLLMSYSIIPFEVIMGLMAGYILLRLALKLRQVSTEQLVILLGFAFFLFAFLWDALYYNGIRIIQALHFAISEMAMAVFVLFGMVAMVHGTMRQAREAHERERMLAVENAALDRVNRLKTELMANLTHEMRTPLAVMSVYSQLAVKAIQEGNLDEQAANDLNMISSEAKRLADMASNALHVFGEQATAMERAEFSIEKVIRQIARLSQGMMEKKGNTMQLHIQDGLPDIYGRADECAQLIWNIITNANSHTQGGSITTSAKSNDEYVHVSIEDTGEGISAELLPHVFQRYTKEEGGGMGLGLSICKEIVEAHGGTISIFSTEGIGTTVFFSLPIAKS